MLKTADLFSPEHTIAREYLFSFEYPWQALPGLRDAIVALGNALGNDYIQTADQVWIHTTAIVAPTASIAAPCIIGPGTQVRHCAFIRGSVLVGTGCVVGNSVELKNVILFDKVEVPHFNYAGDSILGYKAHLGAGAVTSNIKSDRKPVVIRCGEETIATGMRKIGAMLGDFAEVGCNSVLNPGSIIGPHATVYPLSCVRGTVPGSSIYKTGGVIVPKEE